MMNNSDIWLVQWKVLTWTKALRKKPVDLSSQHWASWSCCHRSAAAVAAAATAPESMTRASELATAAVELASFRRSHGLAAADSSSDGGECRWLRTVRRARWSVCTRNTLTAFIPNIHVSRWLNCFPNFASGEVLQFSCCDILGRGYDPGFSFGQQTVNPRIRYVSRTCKLVIQMVSGKFTWSVLDYWSRFFGQPIAVSIVRNLPLTGYPNQQLKCQQAIQN